MIRIILSLEKICSIIWINDKSIGLWFTAFFRTSKFAESVDWICNLHKILYSAKYKYIYVNNFKLIKKDL